MTALAQAGSSRPPKPRSSPWIPVALVAFVPITWTTLSDEFGIGLELLELIEDLTRGAPILADLLQPNWAFVPTTVGPMLETIAMAIIASAIGCLVGLPVAFLASRVTAPNRVALFANRSVLSVIRSMPDILYALIFVAAVGVGPVPGMAALILFNIGVVAKLLSETIDGVDTGPIEAGRAAGANRTQTVRWSVLPQVLPNYVAYSLYTFELNVRASTVLGIVGAGGMGNLLFIQYRFFNWENVSVVIIELFALVFVIEVISIWLRRRLV